VDLFLQDSVFHRRKSKSGKLLFIAAREKTKHQVKHEVILNSQSKPGDNLVELEFANIPCQEYGFPSVTIDKAEAVKNKQELVMDQLKEREEEVQRLNEC